MSRIVGVSSYPLRNKRIGMDSPKQQWNKLSEINVLEWTPLEQQWNKLSEINVLEWTPGKQQWNKLVRNKRIGMDFT